MNTTDTPSLSELEIAWQHIEWLKIYTSEMKPENWRDMRLHIERQLDKLSDTLSRLSGNGGGEESCTCNFEAAMGHPAFQHKRGEPGFGCKYEGAAQIIRPDAPNPPTEEDKRRAASGPAITGDASCLGTGAATPSASLEEGRLKAIHARLVSVPPPPWRKHDHNDMARLGDNPQDWIGYAWVGQGGEDDGRFDAKVCDLDARGDASREYRESGSAVADFIANSPADIAYLLGLLQRIEATGSPPNLGPQCGVGELIAERPDGSKTLTQAGIDMVDRASRASSEFVCELSESASSGEADIREALRPVLAHVLRTDIPSAKFDALLISAIRTLQAASAVLKPIDDGAVERVIWVFG